MDKERAKTILLDLHNTLDEAKIGHMLFFGTLLGAYRNNDFLSEDIDIVCNATDYDRFIQLFKNKPDWSINRVWRKEVALFKYGRKIDILFADVEDINTHLYIYKKNDFTKRWDTEQRYTWKSKDIFPLQKREFLGKEFYVPNNPSAIFECYYGKDWQTPNPNWSRDNNPAPNLDHNYKQIGFIIPTFIRDDKMMASVKSILKTYPLDWFRLYIGDQGKPEESKDKFYTELKQQGHFINYYPYDSGLSFVRNELLKSSKEPYLIIMDDDFIYSEESRLEKWIRVLLEDSKIGVVGGALKNYQKQPVFSYNFKINYDKDKKIIEKIKFNPVLEKTLVTRSDGAINYYYSDIVLNFAMFKREVFDDVMYDNSFPLAEHLDFYIQLKNKNKWMVTFTDSVLAEHIDKSNELKYHRYRNTKSGVNIKKGFVAFEKKYGVHPTKIITREIQ